MPYTEEGSNVAADAVAAAFPWAALFDGDPTSGGVEITGGTPAYARQQLDFSGAATGGTDAAAAIVSFDIPAGATVAWAGLFDADTGGTMGAFGQVPLAGPFGAQGTYDLLSASVMIV